MDQHARPQPKPLPVGISDFKELIEKGFAYADKSLFIQELLQENVKVAIIPRMRRFGKTLNMSMLRYFFEKTLSSNAHLFKDLAISKHPDIMAHQGKHPVVYLTLSEVKEGTWTETYDSLRGLISDEFERHSYLLNGTSLTEAEKRLYNTIRSQEGSPALYTQSLKRLTRWLARHHQQPVIILIDEYDTPVHESHLNGYYKQLIRFMRNWLTGGLKDNASLRFGVVTGILRIAKESMFSGLNNDIPYTVLKPNFSSCFGFLEHEVKELLATHGLAGKHDAIRRSYDGYTIGDQSGIYNPWSVIECIKSNGAIGTYWASTGSTDLIKSLITKGPVSVKGDLEALLRGETIARAIPEGLVFPDLEQNADAIWALLLYSGYLTPARMPESPKDPCELRIPNEEVRDIFASIVEGWFRAPVISAQYHEMLAALTAGDVATFVKRFEDAFVASWSVFDVSPKEPECIYHAFVLGMIVWLHNYVVRSNRESGYGRYDVILLPKDRKALGVIIEFKVFDARDKMTLKEVAESALTQIEERRYAEELRDQGVQRILCLGIAFAGKKVLVAHRFVEENCSGAQRAH